jgi:alkylhydroperoxidase/carboxymuconolactone decarboxylase family protein YurZ
MGNNKKRNAKQLAGRIAKERGFPRLWRSLLAERDPDFLKIMHKAMMHFLYKRNALPLKFKEIIIICLDAITSYEEGLRIHVRNALEAGATEDEIIEALEICSLSIHNLSIPLPAIVDEVKKYKKRGVKAKRRSK